MSIATRDLPLRNAGLRLRKLSPTRPRHRVSFYCFAPTAKTVRLAWVASLELNHGHHHYLFIVDGDPMLDPRAAVIARNDWKERVSLIAVG